MRDYDVLRPDLATAAAHALLLPIKERKAASAELQKTARTTTTKPPLPRVELARRPDTAGTPLRIPFGNQEAAQPPEVRYRNDDRYGSSGVELALVRERGWI